MEKPIPVVNLRVNIRNTKASHDDSMLVILNRAKKLEPILRQSKSRFNYNTCVLNSDGEIIPFRNIKGLVTRYIYFNISSEDDLSQRAYWDGEGEENFNNSSGYSLRNGSVYLGGERPHLPMYTLDGLYKYYKVRDDIEKKVKLLDIFVNVPLLDSEPKKLSKQDLISELSHLEKEYNDNIFVCTQYNTRREEAIFKLLGKKSGFLELN